MIKSIITPDKSLKIEEMIYLLNLINRNLALNESITTREYTFINSKLNEIELIIRYKED